MSRHKSEIIARFVRLAMELQADVKCQITKLACIQYLADSEYNCRYYYLYLLERSYCRYIHGLSLNTVTLLDDVTKKAIYREAIYYLRILYKDNEGMLLAGKEIITLYEMIHSLSSGRKRISIHASRRKMPDPDLLLIEETLRYSINHWYNGVWAYFLTQYFVTGYRGYRFFLDYRSAPRIIDIAEFWRWHQKTGGVISPSSQAAPAGPGYNWREFPS